MTTIKISQLPNASLPITGAEIAPIVQNDVTKNVPLSAISQASAIINVKTYGAVGNGIANDTAAIAAAFVAAPAGAVILFPPGTYLVSTINVTGKSVVLSGYGATINSTGANGGIYKTDHGNKLTVVGLSFTGAGAGIKQDAPIIGVSQDELDIFECSFNMNSGVYGINVVGGRNCRIQNCFFRNGNSGNGIYFKNTVSPFVDTCTFKGEGYVGRAVYYPGTGAGTDAGLIIENCEILGWDKGVEVVGCDWLVIQGSTIDYNNYSIKLGSQDGANISNNYIGSLANNAAMWITSDPAGSAPNFSEKIYIVNNTFVGHATNGNLYDCILINGTPSPNNIIITNNAITFYTRYGINFTMTNTRLIASQNTFDQSPLGGTAPINSSLGASDSGIVITQNIFNNATTISAMNLSVLARVNENLGCATEGQGETVVPISTSTTNVAHGQSYTPSKTDIWLTPTNNNAAAANPYIDSVDATNITIGFTPATGGDSGVAWRVRRGPG